jgi:hemerythrin superfamily protein
MAAKVKAKGSNGRSKRRRVRPADDWLDAVDLLEAQHRYVDRLFSEIERARGARKTQSFDELAQVLALHTTIEARIFYPGVKTPATEELLRESAQEHLAMERVLADLRDVAIEIDSHEFDAKLGLFKQEVHHHAVDEEERTLFPIVRAALDGDYLAGLAGEMVALMVSIGRRRSEPSALARQ